MAAELHLMTWMLLQSLRLFQTMLQLQTFQQTFHVTLRTTMLHNAVDGGRLAQWEWLIAHAAPCWVFDVSSSTCFGFRKRPYVVLGVLLNPLPRGATF